MEQQGRATQFASDYGCGGMAENDYWKETANGVRDVETLNNLEAVKGCCDWWAVGWSGASGVLEPSLS